ncbi:SRPBCC family protein [Antrihabitans stalactiti]|uniref:SRPBCC family protein n=1 Tax=Antrihabitans stalactiti TaxID=2584121 RepID=UPI00146E6A98|nr:SRPBCC family protein [Antrihabitans stalactiti]
MGHVANSAEVNATADHTFAYISDYRNIEKYMLGLERFEPTGTQTRGVGAEFTSTLDIGPMKLDLHLSVLEWVNDSRITLRCNAKKMEATTCMQLDSLRAESTQLSVTCDYTVGSGLTAKAIDVALLAFSKAAIRYVEKHLREQIEDTYTMRAQHRSMPPLPPKPADSTR